MRSISNNLALEGAECDSTEKIARTEAYSTRLITQGGPATDLFIGKVKIKELEKAV